MRDEATRAVERGVGGGGPARSGDQRPRPAARRRQDGGTRGAHDGGGSPGAGGPPSGGTGRSAKATGRAGRGGAGTSGRERDRATLRQPGTPIGIDERLGQAARAFERERYADARRTLATLVARAPEHAEARELYGLTLYRLGRWKDAIRELTAFHDLTGSYEQHPVLADCHRAQGRHREVRELWDELKAASPAQEVMVEGRIVAAGSLADQGDVAGAIALLEDGPVRPKRVAGHHLRLWYALGDLYERAGDLPRARELFGRIVRHEPDFVDVAERLAHLE